MRLKYMTDVDVSFDESDLGKILDGEVLSGVVYGEYSGRPLRVNVVPSDKKFYSSGGLAEGFDDDSFQGWVLERPREVVQLTFPWENRGEEIIRDYDVLDIKISKPALVEVMESENAKKYGGYFCGMARGIHSEHNIDRLNLRFSLTP